MRDIKLNKVLANSFIFIILIHSIVHELGLLFRESLFSGLFYKLSFISFVYMFFCMLFLLINKQNKLSNFTKWILIIVFVLTIFRTISCLYNNYFHLTDLGRLFNWPLVFINFVLTKPKINDIKKMSNITYVILVFLSIPLIYLNFIGEGQIGTIIFPTYIILSLTPLILYINENKRRKILLFIVLFMLMTLKRTGILCSFAGLIMYYVFSVKTKISFSNSMRKIVIGFMIAVMFILTVLIINSFVPIQVVQRFFELSSDGGSGRNGIWEEVIFAFNNADSIHKFIGYGSEAVPRIVMPQGRAIQAHNDYIEALFDFGYIGFFLLVILSASLVAYFVYMLYNREHYTALFGFAVISILLLSMFSYLYLESYVFMGFAAFFGCIIPKISVNKRRIYGFNICHSSCV